jgi:hypothetical protein
VAHGFASFTYLAAGQAANRMARALFGIATDASVNDSVKLVAIRVALDRARLNPKAAVEVDLVSLCGPPVN